MNGALVLAVARTAFLEFWRTPEAACSQGTCVPYSRWATDYVAVMGGR